MGGQAKWGPRTTALQARAGGARRLYTWAMPNLDHPTIPALKDKFNGQGLSATEFRGQTTVVVPPARVHEVLAFLKNEGYDFLSDVVGVDYLNYPKPRTGGPTGRFAVVYNLLNTSTDRRIFIKTLMDPTLETRGTEPDPALEVPTATDLWPGAEWLEREVFDMFGIRFTDHPDHRRILMWEAYPTHPLRKDYPVRGSGERESLRVVERDSA